MNSIRTILWASFCVPAAIGLIGTPAVAQSVSEGSAPASVAAGAKPAEATAATVLSVSTSEATALLDQGGSILESGDPGFNLGSDWSSLAAGWRRLAAELESLGSVRLSGLEQAQADALLDRARLEILRFESCPWHTDPNWIARRAFERVRSLPEDQTVPEYRRYLLRVTSLPELLGAARRSVVRARPAAVAQALETARETGRLLSGPIPKQVAKAELPHALRDPLRQSLAQALEASHEFEAWLTSPNSFLPFSVSPLPEGIWLERFRAATGHTGSLVDIERALLERLRQAAPESEQPAAQLDPERAVPLIQAAVTEALAPFVASGASGEDASATFEVRVTASRDPLETEPVRFGLEAGRLDVELMVGAPDEDPVEAASRAKQQRPAFVAALAAGYLIASRAAPQDSLGFTDPMGFRALELAWPTFAPEKSEPVPDAVLQGSERRLDRECAILLAALRLHGRGAERAEAARALQFLDGFSEAEAESLMDRMELDPELGMSAWIALQWKAAAGPEGSPLRLRTAVRKVPGVRPAHLKLE